MAKLQAPNYTQLPNALIALIPFMGEAETKIAIIIARETFGWHRQKAKLSLSELSGLTGLTKQGAIAGIKAGIKRGIIGREQEGQGFVYFLILDDGSEDELPGQVVNEVDQSPPSTSQRSRPLLVNDVDMHEDKEKEKENYSSTTSSSAGGLADERFVIEMEAEPAYRHLEVRRVYAKMMLWCRRKGKQPTEDRFVGWLNREQSAVKNRGDGNGGNQSGKRESASERNARVRIETEQLLRYRG